MPNHPERDVVRSRDPLKCLVGTSHISGMADLLRCCQLRWMVNCKPMVNLGYQFITLIVDICVQHSGPEALCHTGLSAASETCTTSELRTVIQGMILVYVAGQLHNCLCLFRDLCFTVTFRGICGCQ